MQFCTLDLDLRNPPQPHVPPPGQPMSSARLRARGKGPKELRREAKRGHLTELSVLKPSSGPSRSGDRSRATRASFEGSSWWPMWELARRDFIPGCRTAIQSQPAATAPIRMQDLKDCPQGLVFCMFNVHEGSGSNPRCQCGGTFEEVPRHSASNRSLHLHSSSLITVFITLNITPPI